MYSSQSLNIKLFLLLFIKIYLTSKIQTSKSHDMQLITKQIQTKQDIQTKESTFRIFTLIVFLHHV